jgi:DNA-binding PadR family transcriptional regulator
MRTKVCRRIVLHNDLGISDSFWVKAWFLAELYKGNAHGYELINSLSTIFPQEATQTSSVMGGYYRLLRELEVLGLVNSSWDTSGNGPARRVYSITEKGKLEFISIIEQIKHTKEFVDKFLDTIGKEVK